MGVVQPAIAKIKNRKSSENALRILDDYNRTAVTRGAI